MKRIFGLFLIAALAIISCTSDLVTTTGDSSNSSFIDLRTDTLPCFEFVFPITVHVDKDSVVTVNSLDELKALKGNKHGRPRIDFPFQIINSAGETVTISSPKEFDVVRRACNEVNDTIRPPHPPKGGHHGFPFFDQNCFTIVYPVSVQLSDSSIVAVNSIEEAKALNDSTKHIVAVVFPVNVVNAAGETVTVNSMDDVKKLLEACNPKNGGFGNNGHHPKGGPGHNPDAFGGKCFKLVFPLSISYPDGTVTEYSDPKSMTDALKAWGKDNQNSTVKPDFQYPIQVILKGETQNTTVNSREELDTLKSNC